MARKSGLLMALALLVFLPASVSSLGLGEIRLNSYLNEPLDAEVTITTASPEELDSLKVAVASEEAFDRFGIERPAFLRDLTFDVETASNGGATLRIRSPDPVIEPFLTFLIEADWAGGRLLREYTVLLDPPLFLPEPKQVTQPEAPVADVPPGCLRAAFDHSRTRIDFLQFEFPHDTHVLHTAAIYTSGDRASGCGRRPGRARGLLGLDQ